nr:gustatory receptor 21 [Papilio memnon]
MSEPPIDMLSKIYIIANWFIGINRLTEAFKVKGLRMFVAFLFCFRDRRYNTISVPISTCETLQKFYNELCEFDKNIKINFQINFKAKVNFVLAILLIFIFIIGMLVDLLQSITSMVIIFYVNNIIELYYGHLFLLQIILKSIRVLLVSTLHSLTETEGINLSVIIRKLISNNFGVEIKKLSLLYYNVIKAYDFLNVAIKWRLLFSVLFFFTFQFMWTDTVPNIVTCVIKLLPLVVPCFFGEALRNEVCLLHAAIKRIYNLFGNIISSIRLVLFRLLIAASLTFSVFRMIEINTFPFKFIGLEFSYVLIILQFQKVVKSDNH